MSKHTAATLPQTVCLTNTGTVRLLGPAPNGIIAGLPLLVVAMILYFHEKETGEDRIKP